MYLEPSRTATMEVLTPKADNYFGKEALASRFSSVVNTPLKCCKIPESIEIKGNIGREEVYNLVLKWWFAKLTGKRMRQGLFLI